MNAQVHNLDNTELQRIAPAVFAEAPADRVSDRYTFIPTIEVVDGLRNEGWYPVSAQQSRAKSELGSQYAQHQIRFRHRSNELELKNEGDVVPEVVLYNSHNAGSSFQFNAGLFRLACSNGLVVADSTLAGGRVRHVGDVAGEIIEGVYEVLEDFPKVIDNVKQLQAIETTPEEQILLARSASLLRWEEGKAPVTPKQILQTHRYGDDRPDLWTQFNVIQENILRGGQRGRATTGRRLRTQPIGAPDKNIGINKALWELANGFAELKRVA